MQVLLLTVRIYAPWVQSLKEKRMEVKSLVARLKSKFNVSVCEADAQDVHKTIVIAVAAVCADTAKADSVADHVLEYIASNTEGEIIEVSRELR